MAFQLSPGVNVSEIDLTQIVTPPSSSVGAVAGNFEWGPALEITQITTEKQLREIFGKPTDASANAFFTAASFLSYSSDIRVIRTVENGAENASNDGNGTATPIYNKDVYMTSWYPSDNVTNHVCARYPGRLGNGLKVEIFANNNPSGADWTGWEYNGYFDRAPGTSQHVKTKLGNTIANDEMHIVIVDGLGKFSGVAGTVLETYAGVSKATNAKDQNGRNNWWREVIARDSKYIYVIGKPGITTSAGVGEIWDQEVSNSTFFFSGTLSSTANGRLSSTLTGGALPAVSEAQIKNAYDLLKTDDLGTDVSLVMSGGDSVAAVGKYIVDNIAEVRKDIVVFISPDRANVVGATDTTGLTGFRNNALANLSSSYAVMDSGWKYMYDRYNEKYRWVPLNGDIAGICARTDLERDPWWSPAGLVRGQVKNAVKLAFNPTKAQRDLLYQNGINPVISASGDGTILFGDKTMQSYASAFDRINVRRLFIALEKAIARAARTSLFEFNDEFTRAQFVNLVEPFLRTVQGRRGIYDFRVVCDETNNTPDVIDRNEFVGDIYIKPARSINFIQLNFVAVATGVSFEEIVGQF